MSPVAESPVSDLVRRARAAQAEFARWPQARVDEAALACGWAIMKPENNRALAEMAVRDSGLGNVEDKFAKNYRKTLGLLRDIAGVKTVGVIAASNSGVVALLDPWCPT